jgi:hypothetical protein
VRREQRIRTEPERLADVLGARPRTRGLLEASTQSEWVAATLEALGHEVVVANPNYTPMYATRTRDLLVLRSLLRREGIAAPPRGYSRCPGSARSRPPPSSPLSTPPPGLRAPATSPPPSASCHAHGAPGTTSNGAASRKPATAASGRCWCKPRGACGAIGIPPPSRCASGWNASRLGIERAGRNGRVGGPERPSALRDDGLHERRRHHRADGMEHNRQTQRPQIRCGKAMHERVVALLPEATRCPRLPHDVPGARSREGS